MHLVFELFYARGKISQTSPTTTMQVIMWSHLSSGSHCWWSWGPLNPRQPAVLLVLRAEPRVHRSSKAKAEVQLTAGKPTVGSYLTRGEDESGELFCCRCWQHRCLAGCTPALRREAQRYICVGGESRENHSTFRCIEQSDPGSQRPFSGGHDASPAGAIPERP
jgi:hypothetical protein